MDHGKDRHGAEQVGPSKEPREKRRKSLRSKHGKQPTSYHGSALPPAVSSTTVPGCSEAVPRSSLPGVSSPVASSVAPSQPSEPSKTPPGGTPKTGADSTRPAHHSTAHGGKATAAQSKSKPNLDASKSKQKGLHAIPVGAHKASKASSPAGVKARDSPGNCQEQPAAPVVASSETAENVCVGGAVAVNMPAADLQHSQMAPESCVKPPRPKEAGRQERKKSKGGSFANMLSAEESFTPASSREAAMKKTNVVSSSLRSFYPLNVMFVTELTGKEERYMYAAVVVVLVAVFALAMVALLLLLSRKPPTEPVMCDTAECIEARDYLNGLLNTSKDTCSDFYAYVCNSWLDHATDQAGPRSFIRDTMAASVSTITDRLLAPDFQAEIDSLKVEPPAESAEGKRVLRVVYKRCHRYVSEEKTAEAFKATLASVREHLNWTLIREARTYRDLVGLIARTSLLAGFHTVFILDLLSEKGKTVLRLSPGKSLLTKLAVSGNRGELERDLQRVLENDDERALVLGLDELVASDLQLDDGAMVKYERWPLSALLENLVPEVTANDWMAALNQLLYHGEESMHASDTSYASGAEDIRSAFSKIYNHSDINKAALYLASHLDAELLFLELSRERAMAHPSETADFCLDLARRCFGYTWPRLAARFLDLDHSAHALYSMFHELKRAFHQAPISTWLPEKTQDDAVRKINKATLIFASEESAAAIRGELDYTSVAQFLKEAGGDFVRFFVLALEHEHWLRLRRPPTQLQLLLLRLEQRSQLARVAPLDKILVPTLFQLPPLLYSTAVPAYFNYGTVGALLAAAIVETIGPAAADGSDKEMSAKPQYGWWTPEALHKYNESSHCLKRLYWRLGLHAEVAGNEEEQRRAMFLGAHGLRLAYDSLADNFRRTTGSPNVLGELWLSAQIIFFARFCLLWCNTDQRPNPLSPRGNCLLPLHNMPEFDAAFACAGRTEFVTDNCVV